jgi:hypothetical protein
MKAVSLLEGANLPWCMIGGLAVNHWADEPMVTRDVDIVIALDRVDDAVALFTKAGFAAKRFPFSVNITGKSQVSIQISTDAEYKDFPSRSVPADIHGILMRVSSLEDTLRGKILAWSDKERRGSKRQKDLADIARLLESHPHLEPLVPGRVMEKIKGL